MGIDDVISRVKNILEGLGDVRDWIVVDAFHGKLTVFGENKGSRDTWDMNAKMEGGAAEIECVGKEHAGSLISAGDMEDPNAWLSAVIGDMALGGDGGVHEGEGNIRMRRIGVSVVGGYASTLLGDPVAVSNDGIKDVCGPRFCGEGEALKTVIEKAKELGLKRGFVDDGAGGRLPVLVEERCYLVPREEGEAAGMSDCIGKGARVGLVVGCGKSKSDVPTVRAAGDYKNGIGLWAGPEEDMPEGANIFKVEEGDLREIRNRIVEMVSERREI